MLGPLSSRGESGERRTTSCARGLRQSTGKRAGVNILLNERERCAVCVRPCTSDELLCVSCFIRAHRSPSRVRPPDSRSVLVAHFSTVYGIWVYKKC